MPTQELQTTDLPDSDKARFETFMKDVDDCLRHDMPAPLTVSEDGRRQLFRECLNYFRDNIDILRSMDSECSPYWQAYGYVRIRALLVRSDSDSYCVALLVHSPVSSKGYLKSYMMRQGGIPK